MSLIRMENVKIGGVDWTSRAMLSSTTTNSDGLSVDYTDTNAAVLMTLSGNTSMSFTLRYQVSDDNVTYYTPVDLNNSAQSTLCNGSVTGTRYIKFEPVVSKYMRFQTVTDAVSPSFLMTLKFIQAESVY